MRKERTKERERKEEEIYKKREREEKHRRRQLQAYKMLSVERESVFSQLYLLSAFTMLHLLGKHIREI